MTEPIAPDLAAYVERKHQTLANKNQEITRSVITRNPHLFKRFEVYPGIMGTMNKDFKIGTLEIAYVFENPSPRGSYISLGNLVIDENTKQEAEIHIPVGQIDMRESFRSVSEEILRLNCCTLIDVKYCVNSFKNDLVPGALCLTLFPQRIPDTQCRQCFVSFDLIQWPDGDKQHSLSYSREKAYGVTCSSVCTTINLENPAPGELILKNSLFLKKIKAPFIDLGIPQQFYRHLVMPSIQLRYLDVTLPSLTNVLPQLSPQLS